MVQTWTHGIDMDSWFIHGLMVNTWTHGIGKDSWYGNWLMAFTTPMVLTSTHGIVLVLLNHTRTCKGENCCPYASQRQISPSLPGTWWIFCLSISCVGLVWVGTSPELRFGVGCRTGVKWLKSSSGWGAIQGKELCRVFCYCWNSCGKNEITAKQIIMVRKGRYCLPIRPHMAMYRTECDILNWYLTSLELAGLPDLEDWG